MFIELHNTNLINLDFVRRIECVKVVDESEPYHLNFIFEDSVITLTYHTQEKCLLARQNLKKLILQDKKLINYTELVGVL